MEPLAFNKAKKQKGKAVIITKVDRRDYWETTAKVKNEMLMSF